MHAPLLQTLPALAQSVHVLPPVPQAALAFAMTHPASPAQQVLQLLGPQAMAPPLLLPVPLLPLLPLLLPELEPPSLSLTPLLLAPSPPEPLLLPPVAPLLPGLPLLLATS